MSEVDYDGIAHFYDQRYVEHDYEGIGAALDRFLAGRRDVLEVGCGTGHWLELLTSSGFRVCGLDASVGMLAEAAMRNGDLSLVLGSAEALPFASSSFDGVLAINALHHFPEPEQFVREARRVLRPGGGLLIAGLDPSSREDEWYVYDYFAGTLETDRARYPSRADIAGWLTSAGFEDVSSSVAQRMTERVDARPYLERGAASKHVTSQLALLDDGAYTAGIAKIWSDINAAEERGETHQLRGDLRIHATAASVPGE